MSDGRRLTFHAVGREVDRIAAGLHAEGIVEGDRVALFLGPCIEMTIAVFALWRIGAVAVPLDTRLAAAETERILLDCGAVALVYEASLGERLPLASRTPALVRRWRCGTSVQPSIDECRDVSFETAGIDSAPAPDMILREDAAALVVYTSGTSGRPKGAVISHLNVVHSIKHYEFAWGLGPHDRSILAIPASNITGLIAVILSLMHAGGCVVYMRSFKAADFLALASRERITHAFMVPAMYKLCLLCPDLGQFDLSTWRLGSYGGSTMAPAIIAEIYRRLPGLELMSGYGATETTSPAVMLPRHLTASHSDTVGFPLPCAEVCVMDENGREVADGQKGELWIKGPMVVRGYWNNAAETAGSFTCGFWHSGDICSRDASGLIRFHDRMKDSINRGGYKIYSVEIENLLMQQPGVSEVAVIAKPDPVLGERVHAVVSRQHPDVTEAALTNACSAMLADYKVPESFTLLDEPLPRNANGKVVKRSLRERYFGN